jgi:hypothetical protein
MGEPHAGRSFVHGPAAIGTTSVSGSLFHGRDCDPLLFVLSDVVGDGSGHAWAEGAAIDRDVDRRAVEVQATGVGGYAHVAPQSQRLV